MTRESISFSEAEQIIAKNASRFADAAVVGLGIAQREQELHFVVAVKGEPDRARLARKFEGRDVAGFPVRVETGGVMSLSGVGPSPAAVVQPVSIIREVLDRPGFLVLAAILVVAIAVVRWL